jgi:hypothetical protein
MCERMACMNAPPRAAEPAASDLEAMRPTLVQALKDAKDYHYDGLCGDPEHTAWVEQYERALDILEPRPVLTSAIPAPNPG